MMKQKASTGEKQVVLNRDSWKKDFIKNGSLYIMILPVVLYYILFHYKTMYGALMAFQDFVPRRGIGGSEWIGFKHFIDLFTSSDFWRLLKNTLTISVTSLIVNFPLPIVLALFLNEIRSNAFKRTVQTLSYLPHFISMVVLCGMVKMFVEADGIIGSLFSGVKGTLLNDENMFVPIYVLSGAWQGVGWGSIMYLSAIAGIDYEQFEAAEIDGAGRFRKMWSITLPSIKGTIIVLLVLNLGNVMSVGYEKVMLLYSPAIYSKADVISTYVYRMGLISQQWGFSAAVGLFNSVVNMTLVFTSNYFAKKLNGVGIF